MDENEIDWTGAIVPTPRRIHQWLRRFIMYKQKGFFLRKNSCWLIDLSDQHITYSLFLLKLQVKINFYRDF